MKVKVILSEEFIRTINEARRLRNADKDRKYEIKQAKKDIKNYEEMRTWEGIDLVKLDNLLTRKRNELEQISR